MESAAQPDPTAEPTPEATTAAPAAEPEPTLVEATDPDTPPMIEDVITQGALSPRGFDLGEHGYNVSCAAVSADAVTDDVLGTGELLDDPAEARAIAGVAVDVAVAVNRPGGDCLEGDPLGGVLSDWSFAFAAGAGSTAAQQATCTAGAITPTQELANRCHEITGAPVVSCGDTPVFPEWVLTSLADLTPAGPALGPSLDLLLADRSDADRQGWRLITDIEVGEDFQYLMLRDSDGQLDYLLTTAQMVLAGPAPCAPEPAT